MKRSIRVRCSTRYGPALAAWALALGLVGCNTNAPSYKGASVSRPLEVPPDLTGVRSSESMSIPGSEPTPSSSKELEEFEKFRKFEEWAEFEEFLAWRQQRGGSDAGDFEAFRAAKYGTTSSLAGRVMMEPSGTGYQRLRVYGDLEPTWNNVGESFARMEVRVKKTKKDDGYYLIEDTRPEQARRSGLAFWKKSGEQYRVALADEGSSVVVTVRDRKGGVIANEAANGILNQLYGELESYARLAGPLEPVPGPAAARQDARLEQTGDGHMVMMLSDDFPRAWRRVGVTLARVGFTVEDRDRNDGVYVVRYVEDVERKKQGLGKLAFWKQGKIDMGDTLYHVKVATETDETAVRVQDAAGQASDTGDRILALLYEVIAPQ